jgi:hypothetical protein
MAVALSKRVESLEEERLSLTQALDAMKKRTHNAELLAALLSEQRAQSAAAHSGAGAHGASPVQSKEEQALRASLATSTPAAPAEKRSLFSGMLGGKKDAAPASLSDPARVRSLLEEQIHANNALTQASESAQAEVKRLKHLLEATKAERDEIAAREKVLAAAQSGKAKGRKSAGGAALAPPAAAAGEPASSVSNSVPAAASLNSTSPPASSSPDAPDSSAAKSPSIASTQWRIWKSEYIFSPDPDISQWNFDVFHTQMARAIESAIAISSNKLLWNMNCEWNATRLSAAMLYAISSFFLGVAAAWGWLDASVGAMKFGLERVSFCGCVADREGCGEAEGAGARAAAGVMGTRLAGVEKRRRGRGAISLPSW